MQSQFRRCLGNGKLQAEACHPGMFTVFNELSYYTTEDFRGKYWPINTLLHYQLSNSEGFREAFSGVQEAGLEA